MAHILVAIPEGAKPPAMMALQAKAQELRSRALKGEDFAKLARDNSEDSRTRANGGEVGLREASRLLVAYMPYKFIAHRIQLDLSQPWVLGFRRPLFTTRLWAYLDIDAGASRG